MSSRAVELAREEAERVEAEDEQEKLSASAAAPEPEPEPEPEPDEPADEPPAEPEQAFDPKAFEREQRRHEREMRKVLGSAFAALDGCEQCGATGYVARDYAPPPPVLPDKELVVCAECNGYGLRLTPSLAQGKETVPCTTCNGNGWRDRKEVEATAAAHAYHEQPAALPAAPPPPPAWNWSTHQYETADGQPVYIPPPRAPGP